MSLDPDLEEMRRLGHLAVDRAVDHLAALRDHRVATPPIADELRPLVEEPLPREPLGTEATLEKFFADVLPRATLVNHPRFFAYVPGPGSFVGALGEWVAAATNCFVGSWLGGASMAQLELVALDWLREALGLPASFRAGIVTSGGSLANLGALAAARTRAEHRGVPASRQRVLVSTETHYSMHKAARVLGFADDAIVAVPVDAEQRLDLTAVDAAIAAAEAVGDDVTFICATMGTTSTGAVDPIEALADRCASIGAWLHVDGAYGAAMALLEEQTELRALLTRCDSLTLDPHKWLYVPFDCGCLLTRDEAALRAAFTSDAAYLQDVPRDEVNFFERGPELSRGNRALKLWFLLRSVGVDAIADAIRADCENARRAHDLLTADPRIRIVTPVRLSVFSFALTAGEAAGRTLVDAVLADGHVMLSSSRVDGEFVIRFCVANHRTTPADIDSAVERILALSPGPTA